MGNNLALSVAAAITSVTPSFVGYEWQNDQRLAEVEVLSAAVGSPKSDRVSLSAGTTPKAGLDPALDLRLRSLEASTIASMKELGREIGLISRRLDHFEARLQRPEHDAAEADIDERRVAALDDDFRNEGWFDLFSEIADRGEGPPFVLGYAELGLKADRPSIRMSAARAIAVLGGEKAVKMLANAADREENAFVKRSIIAALASLDG